jgi:hypothetical protein
VLSMPELRLIRWRMRIVRRQIIASLAPLSAVAAYREKTLAINTCRFFLHQFTEMP